MTRRAKRGRPPGSRNERTIVREVAAQQVELKEQGEKRKVTVAEALVLSLERFGMRGDVAAYRALDKLRRRLAPEPESGTAVLLAPAVLTSEEWIRQVEIHNLFAIAPEMPAVLPMDTESTASNGESKKPRALDPSLQKPSMRGRLIR